MPARFRKRRAYLTESGILTFGSFVRTLPVFFDALPFFREFMSSFLPEHDSWCACGCEVVFGRRLPVEPDFPPLHAASPSLVVALPPSANVLLWLSGSPYDGNKPHE